jgi:hypothetical protein
MTVLAWQLLLFLFATPLGLVCGALLLALGYGVVFTRISDRYLLREMAVPALIGAGLAFLLLLGNVLYVILQTIYQTSASPAEVVKVLVFQLPWLSMQGIPAALLIGTSLSPPAWSASASCSPYASPVRASCA